MDKNLRSWNILIDLKAMASIKVEGSQRETRRGGSISAVCPMEATRISKRPNWMKRWLEYRNSCRKTDAFNQWPPIAAVIVTQSTHSSSSSAVKFNEIQLFFPNSNGPAINSAHRLLWHYWRRDVSSWDHQVHGKSKQTIILVQLATTDVNDRH